MDLKCLSTLEFEKILSMLADCAVSTRAKNEIKELLPSSNFEEVKRLQQLTSEAYLVENKYLLKPYLDFDEVKSIADKADVGGVLQMGELLKVAKLSRSARLSRKNILDTGEDIVLLKDMVYHISTDNALEKEIDRCIVGENGMRDDASAKLKAIRRKILELNTKLKDRLLSYTKSSAMSKFLQDNIVTVRDGRFVLPVKSESRSEIQGIIHDRSASGSTVFIEPIAIIDMNNDLRAAKLEESAEIERILVLLSGEVAARHDNLILAENQLTMLDIVFSKCSFSGRIDGIEPQINNNGYVNIINSRHPLIAKDKVVPVTISLGKDYKLLLITGPNTGGKTVCLKTVGLFTLMASCGIRIPCDYGSEVSVFSNVFCDIGDEQSITQSLSTFSSHIVNIAHIADNLTPDSLVLLDELGGGTDPGEGAALAIGIIKYIELCGAKGVITTHYSELKEYALVSKNIINGCMQFDEATLRPTYKLLMGIPGVSNALKIAQYLGLNDFIIKNALATLDEDTVKFERVLKNAEDAKSKALEELENTQKIKDELMIERAALLEDRKKLSDKLEKINQNAKLETKRIISNSISKAEDLIDEIKSKISQADEKALLDARRSKKQLEELLYLSEREDLPEYEPLKVEDIKVGLLVVIKSLNSVGVIKSDLDKRDRVDVQMGSIRAKIDMNDLGKNIIKQKNTSSIKSQPRKIDTRQENKSDIVNEIKVLGLTVAEAIEVIEPYLLSGDGTIKIVHGKGTGALSRGLHDYFKRCGYVKSFRFGRYGEGDNGVTFVELK